MSLGPLLSILQLVFALSWVIYVIYLPALAVQAGLPKTAVPWILLMDQAIFIVCDWLAGVYSDRVARGIARVGPRIAMVTLVSGAAFVLMPWIAPSGSTVLFIALTILWSATSSALRAPTFALIGRHAATPARPWMAGLYLLGLGIASAFAPYLGSQLRNTDPRIPFAVATAAVVIVTLLLAAAERTLPPRAPAGNVVAAGTASPTTIALFVLAVVLFAIGFQLHFSVNNAPAYLKFAKPADLERLMPVFWIGFNLLVLPATLLTKRFGGVAIMAAGGVIGTLLTLAAPHAGSLDALVAIQFATGATWSAILMSAFTAALEAGHPDREGSTTGLLFSMLAVAAFARIAFVGAELPKSASIAPLLPSLPAVAWAAAAALAVVLVVRRPASDARSR